MGAIETAFTAYYDAVFDTNREAAFAAVDRALAAHVSPEEIVFDVVIPAIERMVKALTENYAATLSQHFIASRVAEEVVARMIPRFARQPTGKGKIVIGTSPGDFHGLGKKIVAGCLRANIFEVEDLGLNVAPERFVDQARESGASVIGISSMMVHTATGEEGAIKVRALLREKGLEDSIKIIVGGAPYRFDEDMYKTVGADAWAKDALQAVEVISHLAGEVPHA